MACSQKKIYAAALVMAVAILQGCFEGASADSMFADFAGKALDQAKVMADSAAKHASAALDKAKVKGAELQEAAGKQAAELADSAAKHASAALDKAKVKGAELQEAAGKQAAELKKAAKEKLDAATSPEAIESYKAALEEAKKKGVELTEAAKKKGEESWAKAGAALEWSFEKKAKEEHHAGHLPEGKTKALCDAAEKHEPIVATAQPKSFPRVECDARSQECFRGTLPLNNVQIAAMGYEWAKHENHKFAENYDIARDIERAYADKDASFQTPEEKRKEIRNSILAEARTLPSHMRNPAIDALLTQALSSHDSKKAEVAFTGALRQMHQKKEEAGRKARDSPWAKLGCAKAEQYPKEFKKQLNRLLAHDLGRQGLSLKQASDAAHADATKLYNDAESLAGTRERYNEALTVAMGKYIDPLLSQAKGEKPTVSPAFYYILREKLKALTRADQNPVARAYLDGVEGVPDLDLSNKFEDFTNLKAIHGDTANKGLAMSAASAFVSGGKRFNLKSVGAEVGAKVEELQRLAMH